MTQVERLLGAVGAGALDLHAADGHGKTALHHAVDVATAEAVVVAIKLCSALLSKGARVSVADAFGRTPLHVAVAHGQLDLIDVLLSSPTLDGPAINSTDRNGNTALHLAAALTRASVALAATKALLDKGADPLLPNGNGQMAGQKLIVVRSRPLISRVGGNAVMVASSDEVAAALGDAVGKRPVDASATSSAIANVSAPVVVAATTKRLDTNPKPMKKITLKTTIK